MPGTPLTFSGAPEDNTPPEEEESAQPSVTRMLELFEKRICTATDMSNAATVSPRAAPTESESAWSGAPTITRATVSPRGVLEELPLSPLEKNPEESADERYLDDFDQHLDDFDQEPTDSGGGPPDGVSVFYARYCSHLDVYYARYFPPVRDAYDKYFPPVRDAYARYCSPVRARRTMLAAIGLVVLVVVSKSSSSPSEPPDAASKAGVSGGVEPEISSANSIIPYACPYNVKKSKDDTGDYFSTLVEDDKKDKDKTVDDFRSMPLDDWGMAYADVKAMLRPWKEEVFVPNVESGDSIYESACSIGVNLLLTTEILQEHSINDVTVYGNDYVSESAAIADKIWTSEEASLIANKGRFCWGDPSNLDFLPSESFDLVYTGYIDPVEDPLDSHDASLTSEQNWELDVQLCKSSKPEDKKFVKQAQLVQEKWFSSWVQELIRIAKPGKVIAIENSAESICTNNMDWGGVDKSWWSAETVRSYGWDVDPDSIVIRDEKAVGDWNEIRYHVMVRKNLFKPKTSSANIVPYACPYNVRTSKDDKGDAFELTIEDDMKDRNKTLAELRSMDLDEWGMSYAYVKAMLRPWKEEVFVPNLKSGDSIYNSACGIGMNLVITTEILHEHLIDDLTVYGSDYVSESAAIADKIWASGDASLKANKGRFCWGDSSNLDFVPSASFDLVYASYIDPVMDPLNLYETSSLDTEQRWELDVQFCKSTRPEDKELVKRAQLVQEEWFNLWVQELIRIAKPGKVIAIENGAESLCTNNLDWGGVDKSWWSAETVRSYGWDVDPDSIVTRDEEAVGDWNEIRYHVMMRKNSAD